MLTLKYGMMCNKYTGTLPFLQREIKKTLMNIDVKHIRGIVIMTGRDKVILK
jgi:hypothetical protein